MNTRMKEGRHEVGTGSNYVSKRKQLQKLFFFRFTRLQLFFFFKVHFSLIEKKFKKQNKTKQVKDSSGP